MPEVLDGKAQKYLPYNGDLSGKITTKSCNWSASVKASVIRLAAVCPSFATL